MPSCNTYHLTWVSLTLGVGYPLTAAPAKHSHCSLPLMKGTSLLPPFLTHRRCTKRRQRLRPWASALSTFESYPTSEVRVSGPECQAAMAQERPGGATPRPRSGAVAERSYPVSEGSGDREETPHVRGQARLGEAISRPRPGAVTYKT